MIRKRSLSSLLRTAAFAALAVSCMRAQTTSSLRGAITDAGGAVVPGAAVSITNTQTKSMRSTLSDSAGAYQFLQTAPGMYEVKIEKPGFNSVIKSGITLQVNTPATLDVMLEVGAVNEVVNVEASVPLVNTVDASVGNAFTEMQVRQLPLQTRNVVELLSIQPGVTGPQSVRGLARRPFDSRSRLLLHELRAAH